MDTVRKELEENPALEEVPEGPAVEQLTDQSDSSSSDNSDTKEVVIEDRLPQDVDWSNYLDEYNTPGRVHYESVDKESPRFEAFIAPKKSLDDHLLWQFLMTKPTREEEKIASLIIGNLNKDGYLVVPIEDIAQSAEVSLEKIEAVLAILQTFDPVGVCARDLRECLLISDVNVIKGLEPKPGRQFNDETPQYINPDIFVHKLEDDFVIALNDDGMPKLRVNSFYKNSIARGKKISRVMESILRYQRKFFEKGIAHLKPMVLRDVAQDIGMHESTISRVTTNKYAYTPQGIFELKYFFNSSIRRVHGGAIASASVQEKIRQIILSEDPKKPYSDDKISQILKEEHINIARRTVAKYREMLKVLPSNKRKQL